MKKLIILFLLLCSIQTFAQGPDTAQENAWKKIYRASATKINDLVTTKLDVSFDYAKSWMYGKAWITLHPHFYPTDSLTLDAKKMAINEVSIVKSGRNIPLKFTYDSANLRIILDRTYKANENYTIYINYISKPNDVNIKGSIAISGAKGLYFINPDGKDKDKPTQIWTQGETESNSAWVPTIDKPNQKTTDEISMTVPAKYVTLSNGLKVSSKNNGNGTRTDTWKMNLPHAPYLMMMAIGDFSIIKDSYKGKEVSYYVEKEYAPVARKIFGLTPEMIAFYSHILGVDYPWQKYSQVVVRDYVSGAMENTTATLHASSAQQDGRQLIDGNGWETVIAHELFHQWFGDYVTTESWSNITLNESFADYSETLWEEYKYGKDAGDDENFKGQQNYLYSQGDDKDLVRFYYSNREDVFDAVSYQKGGRILNMLRNYVGDSAFFKSLNLYLTTNKFKAAEAHQLRLAFEEITGQDMNWFFNQWYFGSGHPRLDINYSYDEKGKSERVIVKQKQPDKIFKLPVAIDVYRGDAKQRYKVWVNDRVDTFSFPAEVTPELVNFDGDKMLLCEKTENKSLDNYIFQYKNAGLYLDRREAIDYAIRKQSNPKAFEFLKLALKDKYHGLRSYTLQRLNLRTDSVREMLEPILLDMAKNDPKTTVRAGAIEALGKSKKASYRSLYMAALKDSSYSVAGNALLALGQIDSTAALEQAKAMDSEHLKGTLKEAINNLMFTYADESNFPDLAQRFDKLPFGNAKFMIIQPFAGYLKRIKNDNYFRQGIDMIVRMRDTIPKAYRSQVDPYINGMILNGIASSKQSAGFADQADYVRSKLPGYKKPSADNVVVPGEVLQKYTGDYELNGTALKVILKDEKTLLLQIQGQPDVELVPVSNTKFSFKMMEGYAVQFHSNDKNEVTEMEVDQPNGTFAATRKK